MIVLGVAGIIALAGGGRRIINRAGLRNVEAAVIFLMIIILSLPESFRLSPSVSFKTGGILLYVFALSLAFFQRGGLEKFYCLFMSAALGLLFFELGEQLAAFSPYGNPLYIYLVIIALTTAVLSGNPSAAFAIGVLSVFCSDLINFLVYGGGFTLGYGSQFERAALIGVAAAVINDKLIQLYNKLFPDGALMLGGYRNFW